jgi:sorting nexin-1/2
MATSQPHESLHDVRLPESGIHPSLPVHHDGEIGSDDHHRDLKEGRQERILSFADPDPPSVASDITEMDYNKDHKSPPPKGRYSVTVSDPEKRGDGPLSQYVSYKVTTKTEVSPGQYSSDSVLRRYRDFVWLHTTLTRKYKGYLIPSLPDKTLVGRFVNEFINERKRALENFLNRIAVHTELREGVDVDMFLHATDEGVLSGELKDQKFGEDGRLSLFLKDSSNWFSHAFTSREMQVKTDEDRKCDKVVEYAERLDNHLTAVHGQVDTLLNRSKGLIS